MKSRETGTKVLALESLRLGVSPQEICGTRGTDVLVRIRHEICYEIYTRCPHLSFPRIGILMGGRDHTTIMNAVKRHCARIGVTYEEATKRRLDLAEILGVDCSSGLSKGIRETKFNGALRRYAVVMERALAA